MTVCLLMISNLHINQKLLQLIVSFIFETVNYYISSVGAAHVCMLDASKAFDRVNVLSMFRKLHITVSCALCFYGS